MVCGFSFFELFKRRKVGFTRLFLRERMNFLLLFRFATGIEFREGLLLINANCKQQVEKNMTFIVVMGLQNFPNPSASDEAGKTASIFISDTIFVCDVSLSFGHRKIYLNKFLIF